MIPLIGTPSRAGKIKYHLRQWQLITSDPNILGIVTGLEIQFSSEPYQNKVPREYQLSQRDRNILQKEIDCMLENGVIEQVDSSAGQFVSPIFLKEKREQGKFRPIVNFKGLNSHITYQKFKMESLADLKDIIRQNDWMVKLDLKDAFLSVPLGEPMGKYTRFSWEGNLFQCMTLMFGLAPAPRIFTKLLKVPISVLRRLQIRVIIYIDDMLLFAQSQEDILTARDSAIYLLQALGLTINWGKSTLTPNQKVEYLGVIVNSTDLTLLLPEVKIEQLKTMCKNTLTKKVLTVRNLAKVTGRLRATAQAFSPAPLQLRNLQRLMKTALKKYECRIPLDQGSVLELNWWIQNLESQNGKPVSLKTPDLTIISDSSLEGWGAFCQSLRAGGKWSREETTLHINYLELLAVEKAILTFTRIHKVNSIHMLIDNTNALSYLLKMGGKTSQEMNDLAKKIWDYLLKNKISCTGEYIPSELNTEADEESRTTDQSEWKLNQLVFQKICANLGQPEVDLFASLACHQGTCHKSDMSIVRHVNSPTFW